MKVCQKQIESVMALPGPERFKHFVKVVVDWQKAWGLYQDGWALAGTEDGMEVFPLWPALEYAELCAKDEWASYTPKSIDLDDLLNVLLPKLQSSGVLPGVFYTPASMGVTPSVDELREAIYKELENY